MSVPEHPPAAVIKAALMVPIPCATCGSGFACDCVVSGSAEYRLNWQAELIAHSLAENGCLAAPAPPEGETIEDNARWLAEESGHPRYFDRTGNDPGRWRKVLESEADVTVAYTAALNAHPRPDRDYETRLSGVRHDLLRYATGAARRANEGGR